MKLISLALTCAVIALVSIACTETATPTNTPPVNRSAAPSPAASVDEFAAARANFAKHCEGCHAPNGEGGLAKVDDKQIKVPSLKADHAKKHTDDELVKIVTNGEEAMPPFKDKLSAGEITELIRFVRSHFQGRS